MATTLAQLLADAQKRKFTQLVSFIQDIDDKLTLKQIDAVIGNFAGKAYFYLSLLADREIKGAEGATVTRISDVLYLVEAEKADIRITYEE